MCSIHQRTSPVSLGDPGSAPPKETLRSHRFVSSNPLGTCHQASLQCSARRNTVLSRQRNRVLKGCREIAHYHSVSSCFFIPRSSINGVENRSFSIKVFRTFWFLEPFGYIIYHGLKDSPSITDVLFQPCPCPIWMLMFVIGSFGMRHHPKHGSLWVADACDVQR